MADDVMNLAAESGRNIIDDDAEPVLTLEATNASGTGLHLKATTSGGVGLNVDVTGSGAGIDVDVTGAGTALDGASSTGKGLAAQGLLASTIKSTASAANALQLSNTMIASPTVAPLLIASSAASGALMELNVGLVSSASITVATVYFPVLHTGEDKIVYLAGYEIV